MGKGQIFMDNMHNLWSAITQVFMHIETEIKKKNSYDFFNKSTSFFELLQK